MSSNVSATGWNSNGRFRDCANVERRAPVSSRSCLDSPMPVIRIWVGGLGLEAKDWKKLGHWRPCLMSKSIMWSLSLFSKERRRISFDVKWMNLGMGVDSFKRCNAVVVVFSSSVWLRC